MDLKDIGYSQRQRLSFIESVVYWEGLIDRSRVTNAFKVSENHVTKDFRLYKKSFPDNLIYDESMRVYRPSRKFKHKLGKGSAEEYFSFLKTHSEPDRVDDVDTRLNLLLSDSVIYPTVHYDLNILNAVTRAIASKTGLSISYQSMTSPQTVERNVWPHALIFGGTRWHARVYDEKRKDFIDLVIQRILTAVSVTGHSSPSPIDDSAWNTVTEITVIPSPRLSTSQAESIAKEYGMEKCENTWKWKVSMRDCLVKYFIHLYRLDLPSDPQRLVELENITLLDRYKMK